MILGTRRIRGGSAFAVILLAGCATVPDLPDTLDVATSATASAAASKGTGPAGFTNSSWSLARAEDPKSSTQESSGDAPAGPYGGILNGQGLERPPVDERIFVARFGAQGEMVEVTENRYFLAQFYGETVPVGETWVPTSLPGVDYRSASYGLEQDGRFGIAILVQVRFGSTFLGQAVLYSWGTSSGDLIDGQFGYVLDFTGGAIRFLGTIADQYHIEGQRVVP